MNRLVFGYDKDVAEWVAKRVPLPFDPKDMGPFTAIGVMRDGKPIAGFIYSRFNGFDIEISGASVSPQWASRGVCFALLSYPFEQLGCVRVTMKVAKKNKRLRKRLKTTLGFVEEGVHALAYDGKFDACSYGLTRTRWLTGKFGPQARKEKISGLTETADAA